MSSSVKILLYHIDYRTDESDWAQAGTTKAMEDTSFLFKPTQQGVTYTFRVVSHGLLSKSIQSEHVSVAIPAGNMFCQLRISITFLVPLYYTTGFPQA